MPTLKRKKADGTFEFVQLTGIDVKELKDQVTDFNEELAQNAKKTEGIVSVMEFGAKGDYDTVTKTGTDDTEAIRLANMEATKKGKTVYFPIGYKFRTTDTIYFPSNVDVQMDSPIYFESTTPKPAIVYGVRDKAILQRNGKFWAINKNQSNWLDYSLTNEADTMFVGVKLVNVGMSRLEVVQSNGFTIGVECLATNGKGFYFNSVYLGQMQNNKSGVEVVTEGNGWPNSNDFYDGSFTVGGNINVTQTRKYVSSVVRSGTYGSNTNAFHNPKMEGGTDVNEGLEMTPIQLQKANEWQIKNVRAERFAKTFIATFDNSSNNILSFRSQMTSAKSKNEINGSNNNHVILDYEKESKIENALEKSVVFDTGLIKDSIYYNKVNPTADAGNSDMLFYSRASTSFVTGTRKTLLARLNFDANGGIAPSSYGTMGIKVDTSNAKRFLVENKENAWRVAVGLFDINGNVLSGSENISNVKGTLGDFYSLNWYYNQNNDNKSAYYEFSVSDKVYSIVIMVTGYTKRWKVYSLDKQTTVLEPSKKVQPSFYLASDDANIYQITIDGAGTLKATLVTE